MNLSQALIRTLMVRVFSKTLPLYIVNEYPKSGGTWVGQMLSAALEVPFPRNQMPKFETSIMHGHYLNPLGMQNMLCVWRDGRDVLISWYYHSLFENEHHNSKLVKHVKGELCFEDYEDIKENLPAFIEYVFQYQKKPSFSWSNFTRVWHGRKGVVHVRYEDLRLNTAEELKRIIYELSKVEISSETSQEITDKFSFERLAGRRQGEEKKNSFMRKGVVGDWKNHFSKDACVLFDKYAGEELIMLGYEENHEWVKNV